MAASAFKLINDPGLRPFCTPKPPIAAQVAKLPRVRAASEELKTNGLDQIRANVDRGNVPLENAKAS